VFAGSSHSNHGVEQGVRAIYISLCDPDVGHCFIASRLTLLSYHSFCSTYRPQGSNLFVFHIPNNMTNGDMYQLFSQYGHLISVRIMVEKDSGRSRGFGFVSFDNPDSAALAIKELNGYAIGNKRLKVQHKQIRPKDIQQDREDGMHGYGMGQSEGGGYDRSQYGASLPPSGAGVASNGWFAGPGDDMSGVPPKGPDDVTEQTSASTNGETPLNLSGEAALGASPLASLGTLQAALPET
jgi:hypothetical protein